MTSACKGGNIEIIDYLYQEFFGRRKVKGGRTRFKSCSPIEIACETGNIDLLQYLRKVHKLYDFSEDAVWKATRQGKIDIIHYLFNVTQRRQERMQTLKNKKKKLKRKAQRFTVSKKRKKNSTLKIPIQYQDTNELFWTVLGASLLNPTVIEHLCNSAVIQTLDRDLRELSPIIASTSDLGKVLTDAGFVL
jgi:hypothetical protein